MEMSILKHSLAIIYIFTLEYLAWSSLAAPGLNTSSLDNLTKANCSNDVFESFRNCTQTEYWKLTAVMNKQLELEKVLCGTDKIAGCVNITALFKNQGCKETERIELKKIPGLEERMELLQSLCTNDLKTGYKCVNLLNKAYSLIKDEKKISSNISAASVGCCLHGLQKSYNSSGRLIMLLTKVVTKETGIPLQQMCSFELQSRKTTSKTNLQKVTISSTSKTQPSSTPQKMTVTVKSLEKSHETISGRLIAGLVIAAIIFLVVLYVIGRFFYQRIQKKKSAKYEDYGYSQLKVILDDHLYDDDDDEHLLSAI